MALIHICVMFALLLSADALAAADQPRREIRFGVVAQFPPFQSRDPQGQLVGLNIELGNALCVQLNARCVWVDQVLAEDFPSLEARKFDAIMGIAPTSQRRRWVSFTDNLYPSTTRLVGNSTSGLLPYVKWLKGKRVGVVLGSHREAFARVKWARKGVIIKSFWLNDELVRSLVAGEIDAALQDSVEIREALLDNDAGRNFDFLGPPVSAALLGDGVAIAVRKPDTALRNELNCALEQLKQSGEYQRIVQPYRLDVAPAASRRLIRPTQLATR